MSKQQLLAVIPAQDDAQFGADDVAVFDVNGGDLQPLSVQLNSKSIYTILPRIWLCLVLTMQSDHITMRHSEAKSCMMEDGVLVWSGVGPIQAGMPAANWLQIF